MSKTSSSRVEQLRRDANKKGNYQAKLGYAEYLIKHAKSNDEAKPYLLEVLQNKANTYIPEANKLLKEIDPNSPFVDDIAANAHLKFSQNNALKNAELSSITADEDYKQVRYAYVNRLNNMDVHTYSRELTRINARSDVTDNLRSKIYMQFIYTWLEEDLVRKNDFSLLWIKSNCEQLMNNPNLKDSKKAEWARIIHQQVTEGLNKPATTGFIDHMKSHVAVGVEVCRLFTKYLFALIGNCMDIWVIPKCFSKNGPVGDPSTQSEWENKKHGFIYNALFNCGFAALGKFVGKFIGKYVIGSLIGVPIAIIAGLISYPFRILVEYINNSEKIVTDTVSNVLATKVSKEMRTDKNESTNSNIKIFERKGEQHKAADLDKIASDKKDWRNYSSASSSGVLSLYGIYREVNKNEPNDAMATVNFTNSVNAVQN